MIDGVETFAKRCGFCHSQDRYMGLYASLDGNTAEDVIDMLPMLGDMAEGMPPWSGSDDEARMLSEFIESWYRVDTPADEGGN